MTITYELGDSLYINITNRCKNRCDFCVRQNPDWIKDNLWLEREPTAEEIIEDLKKRDLGKYKEIVYCGYGEPTEKIDELIESAKFIKSQGAYKI
ncbi:MAG: radical SAM protein, partial [Clostridiaceae bacterium]|nr:radical SAM protein [Clostridiaceae bacterium]